MLAAYDWSGTSRGSFTLPAPPTQLGEIRPSPDGQRLLMSMPDDTLHVFTAQGADLGRLGAGSKVHDVQWAGDDTHFCTMSSDPSYTSSTLGFVTLGANPRTLTSLHWPEGNGGARLEACSAASDLAVIVVSLGDDDAGHVVEIRVVRLSTGATLRDVHPPEPDFSGPEPRPVRGALWDATSSADGRLLLLMPWAADPAVHRLDWQIADSVSGRVLAHVSASNADLVGNGRWLLTDGHLLDWRTQATIPAPPRCCDGVLAVDLAGDAVVTGIATGPPPTPVPPGGVGTEPPPDDLVILHVDGRVDRLACCGATMV
jgi:hypothetical protein